MTPELEDRVETLETKVEELIDIHYDNDAVFGTVLLLALLFGVAFSVFFVVS